MSKLEKITAVIPVRKGSKRVAKKNVKPFSDTSLLQNKIQTLKNVPEIDEILVTTDCDMAIEIAKKMGVSVAIRPSYYTSDDCPGSENLQYIAKQIKTPLVLYAPVTSPFVTAETYSEVINIFRRNRDINDSVITVNYLKDFLWKDALPLNYDPYNCPRSQDLNSVFKITFGACLISREKMIEKRYVVGDSPFWLPIDDQQAVDIDVPYEFELAEMIYEKQKIKQIEEKELMLLDCTVRDGGFINDHNFLHGDVTKYLKTTSDVGYSVFEIGYLTDKKFLQEKHGVWKNIPFELIDRIIEEVQPRCKISVMMDSWRYDPNSLPLKQETNIDLVRVCAYEEQISQAIEQCKIIKSKGYEVSLNVICISHIEMQVFYNLRNMLLNNNFLDFICFADSYGAATPDLVRRIMILFRNISPTTKIGFHGHDNLSLAMANTITAIEHGADIVDGSYLGLGRGGGNLPLELITLYLNLKNKTSLNIEPLLETLQLSSTKEELNKIKQSICGALNVHPYRLTDIMSKDLKEVYAELLELPYDQKKRI